MEAFDKLFNDNGLAILLALTSFIVGYIINLWFQPRKALVIERDSVLVVERPPDMSDLKISFRDHDVNRIMRTRVFFYNRGNIDIEGAHIERNDRLRVVMSEDNQILHVSTLNFPRKKIIDFDPKLEGDRPTEVLCNFDVLATKDLAAIEIWHTGADEMKIEGTIRGMPKILDLTPSNKSTNEPMSASEFILWMVVAVVSALGLSAIPIDWTFIAAGISISSIQPMILFWRRRRRPLHRHKSFEKEKQARR